MNCPESTWSSVETTTIGKTHPTLVYLVSSINLDVIMHFGGWSGGP